LRPLTYVTLFGLLAATGLRLSEALGLERADLNLKAPSLRVRQTKFKKSRLVPIHVTTAKALADYQQATLLLSRQPGNEAVFLTAEGRPLPKRTVHNTFERLRCRLGWTARGSHPHVRIHDLRHTFICQALLRSQQDHQIDRVADAISTYVGHAKVSDTYWYISATPALMSEASQRFSRFCSGGGQ
jgi:integrase